jgi:hypothetical protein
MDKSLVFIDSTNRGTTCTICNVYIQDKTPSSKARHERTKMHQQFWLQNLATASKDDLPKNKEAPEKKNERDFSDDIIDGNGESSKEVSWNDIIEFFE